LAAYIRRPIFRKDPPETPKKRTHRETADKDHKEIAKLLGALGKSRIASNINQLAKTANSGSLPVNALQEKGYYLARDDRHGYDAVMQLFAAKT